MKNLQSVTVLTEIVPFRLFHFSVSPLSSLIFCFLNVLILSVSRLHKLSKVTLYNNKFYCNFCTTDTSPIYTCISCYTYINKTAGFV